MVGYHVSEACPFSKLCRFPLPDVPKDWTPDPRRVWATDPSIKEGAKKTAEQQRPTDHRAWLAGKTADEVR